MSSVSRPVALAVFTLLATFTSLHWFALIDSFSLGRWAFTVVLSVAAGGGLTYLGATRLSPSARRAASLTVLAGALAGGMLAVGVPLSHVLPTGWDALIADLDDGLAGVSQLELPYEGSSEWTRIGILLAAPLALTLAAGLAFWPTRSGRGHRTGALVVLIALMGVSVTWEAPGNEIANGMTLLLAVAAFIWLPRIETPRVPAAALALLATTLGAAGLASRVDASEPVVDYTSWKIFGDDPIVSFEWNHTYGPIDWPQEGTELFRVQSKEALYWKTVVLDEFDGEVWTRGAGGFGPQGTSEYEIAGAPDRFLRDNAQWVRDFDVSVGRLRTSLAISAGSAPRFEGLDVDTTSGDGTTSLGVDEIPDGGEYGVTAYAPTPSTRALRKASQTYPPGLDRYTLFLADRDDTALPARVVSNEPFGAVETKRERRQSTFRPDISTLLEDTAYARVLGLARRLTRDADTDYEAVAAIEQYLLVNYDYDQEVPQREHPLPAFLFRDRAGYCQQFSGAMALMLRMVGIPSRVVSGFAPGQRLPGKDEFLVRDTDAHSWVEVFFPGVGWVTVDPTPAATPARTQIFASTPASELGGQLGGSPAFSIDGVTRRPGDAEVAESGGGSSGQSGSPLPVLAVLVVVSALGFARFRRRCLLVSPEGAEPQLRELERALRPRLSAAPSKTLLALERATRERFGQGAARYVEGLRGNRYEPDSPRRPGPMERRAFRRALAQGEGAGGWLRALRAVPPGGPRRIRH